MLKNVSIAWTIFIAILISSIIPLIIIAIGTNQTIKNTYSEIEELKNEQTYEWVQTHALEFSNNFKILQQATQAAAIEARNILLNHTISKAEVETRLKKYNRNTTCAVNSINCGTYEQIEFQQTDKIDPMNSNVFMKDPISNSTLDYIVTATEDLDLIWYTILQSHKESKQLYLTTVEGMMRTLPGKPNTYTADWDPRNQIFYTVAINKNPEHSGRWTAPYVVCNNIQMMLTYSIPIYQSDDGRLVNLQGVMSHDISLQDINQQVFDFKANDTDTAAFLLDDEMHVIASSNPNYNPQLKTACETDLTNILEPVYFSEILKRQETDKLTINTSIYEDETNKQWLLTIAPIPELNWKLATIKPYTEVTNINNFTYIIILVVIVSIAFITLIISALTQGIIQPLQRLIKIADDVKGDKQLHPLYLADITNGKNEISQLATAFSKTIIKLQQQFNELNKIFSMGQIIISTLDPKETPQTILRVVKQVVIFDAAEVCIFKGSYLEVIAWSGEREFRNTVGEKYKIGWGLTGMIAKNKQTIFQPTIPTNKQELQLTLGYESPSTELPGKSVRIEVQSFLGVPLLIGKRLIGCLTLVHRKPGHFSRSDLEKLERLMNQAAIALDNTFRVQKREQTLRAKIKELNVEIDEKKLKDQVAEITETEYFRSLQANIAKLRERKKRR